MTITKERLEILQKIGKAHHWDKILEVGILKDEPVYQFCYSKTPKGAKLGYPHLYSFHSNKVYELSREQFYILLSQPLFRNGGKRIY